MIGTFQSTHPSGVRRIRIKQHDILRKFQSTHPSGVRPNDLDAAIAVEEISIHAPQWGATQSQPPPLTSELNFNPRTPVGCDFYESLMPRQSQQFQSTHPSGVRHVTLVGFHHINAISIHAPQWGATARMGIAFHNMEAPSVLKTDFIAKIHVHRSIHKFSNQKHQQTIHF